MHSLAMPCAVDFLSFQGGVQSYDSINTCSKIIRNTKATAETTPIILSTLIILIWTNTSF